MDSEATSIAEIEYEKETTGNQYAGDEKLRVWFSVGSRYSHSKSIEAGRPIFEDVPFRNVVIPGDKTFRSSGKAWIDTSPVPNPGAHNVRHKKQWDAFVAGRSQESTGTPLDKWPQASPALIDTLKYSGIKTVEQLASLSDSNIGVIMGGFGWRQKARDWITAAKDSSHIVQMRAELEKRDAEMASVKEEAASNKEEMSAMKAQLAEALAKLNAASNENRETQAQKPTQPQRR